MKKLLGYIVLLAFATACQNKGNGQLIGVQERLFWTDFDPFGMLFIPMGSYHMGPADQDVPYSQNAQSKVVSVQSFYIDETEITNNEYRQFVNWVRDSIARRTLGEAGNDNFLISQNEYGEDIVGGPQINWQEKLRWEKAEAREGLTEMYLTEAERFYRRKEIDTRKLNFEYYWIDLHTAAKRGSREQGMVDRSVFIKKDVINVYPDTLCWIHDYSYSFNEPMTNMYFWHPAYDEYPVVGVNWRQARAFAIWRTQLLNNFLPNTGLTFVQDFRLPTESEWEYAARGGIDLNPYPWGGPYIRNNRGCFLANFKPMRGNYTDDGGFHTVKTTEYNPNGYGLYCMSGNVAEWTNNAFDESASNFQHDLNPDYQYDAGDSDLPALKRKVIRGGSWKDISFFNQVSSRTYEYQDTSKCYIGFRCVMSYLGRSKSGDTKSKN
jgi:gliding motility-associated lipoprotein GldK